MKLISSMSGAVAIRFALEDVTPPKKIPLQDVLGSLSERYSFMAMNEVSPPNPIVLQNGKTAEGVVINQLQIMQGGYIVFSSDTDSAYGVIEDMWDHMESKFGYEFKNNVKKISYLSALIVEFDGTKKNVLSSLAAVENIIKKKCEAPRYLKKISVGVIEEDPGSPIPRQLSPFELMEQADFSIERRLGTAAAENRFFCAAPLSTQEHIQLLEEIESLDASHAFD